MDNYCGKRLDGRYEIKEIIGVGGMAVVYKAYDNIDDRTVAVKILKEEFLANEEFRRRFKNESKAIAVLSHPNIVKVYDVSFGDRLQYIVMEYIEGITLKEYIEQQKIINWKEAVHFVSQILKALQHAHDKGIVHRDVKPQNIMLLQDGTIKVTDFGIARFSRGDTKTMTEKAIGSVHYISPEQARGEITDDKADLYSVGVVMYEMLTGELPFQSDSAVSVAIMQLQQNAKRPRELNPEIPLGLEQITLRAMQKNARDRYQSAAEMLLDIDEFKRNPSIKFDYNYFVDNEPTRFVDSNAAVAPIKTNDDITEEDEYTPSTNKTMPILFGIVAGLVVIIAIVAGVLFAKNVKKVEVPNFLDKNYTEDILTNEEYKENFKFEIASVESKDKKAGMVLTQTPAAGEKIKKGKTIKLEIAKNDDNILIDGIVGLQSAEAEKKLKENGFSVKVILNYKKDIPVGQVFDSAPAEGTYSQKGTLVTIYAATDENPNEAIVPNLIDYSQDIAKKLIETAGFKMGEVKEENSNKPKGMVISQTPSKGEAAEAGSPVNIVISSGVPAESTAKILVTLPNTGASGSVMKVYLNSVVSFSYNDVLLNGGVKTVEIKGTGATNTFSIVIDDITVKEGKIDFTKSPAEVTDIVDHEYSKLQVIPNKIIGMSVADAKKELELAGFFNIYVEGAVNDAAAKVVSVVPTPDATKKYPLTEKITLTVK
ncbi:MAG: Stk1 family PASTA domain-containing Ser/Thr kinase [Oscillospiraceae bacterium]